MRKVVRTALAIFVLAFPTNASASGPQIGATQGGDGVSASDGKARYVVVSDGPRSFVEAVQIHGGRIISSYAVDGTWGVPSVTLAGETGGLSHDGQLLVLADASPPTSAALRSRSTFLLMSTTPVAPEQIVDLEGDFAFDALSPDSGTLYLIQHASVSDLTSYRVRAYDLQQNRLLPGAIAEKGQAGWAMSGYPVARATSPDGRWVYTLYRRDGGYPFVHALDSTNRAAVCIGLPWPERESQNALTRATLHLDGHTLTVAVAKHSRFMLDTRTFKVTTPQKRGAEEVLPGAAAAAVLFLVCAGFALRRRLRTNL
jgi:hypothetical protein